MTHWSMDKRAPGVLKKKKQQQQRYRDTLETRLISVVRWRIRNVLVLALYALQIVQVQHRHSTSNIYL